MNSVDLAPLYRSSVGFDRLASLIDSALATDTSTTACPAYNIEVLDDNRYVITLAVAGFSEQELDIQVENSVLTIRGNKEGQDEKSFLYQSIDDREFERKFNLADYVEIKNAELTHGLLTINLVKEVPEAMKPKSIAINDTSQVLEHKSKDSASKAA